MKVLAFACIGLVAIAVIAVTVVRVFHGAQGVEFPTGKGMEVVCQANFTPLCSTKAASTAGFPIAAVFPAGGMRFSKMLAGPGRSQEVLTSSDSLITVSAGRLLPISGSPVGTINDGGIEGQVRRQAGGGGLEVDWTRDGRDYRITVVPWGQGSPSQADLSSAFSRVTYVGQPANTASP